MGRRDDSRDRGRGGRSRRSPSRDRRRKSRSNDRRRSPPRGRGKSPPASRYSPRRYKHSKSPRRSRSRSAKRPRAARSYFPTTEKKGPETTKKDAGPAVTPEMKAASVEYNGYLYAAIDFTPPNKLPEKSFEVPRHYENRARTEPAVCQYQKIPPGWELAKPDEGMIEKVIKPNCFGTHLMVLDGQKAYNTAKGRTAGELEMLWEYQKGPDGRVRLEHKNGSLAFWHARMLIQTIKPEAADGAPEAEKDGKAEKDEKADAKE
eukprot:TRINITY_DN33074_c0_g1_i1.p1 TRINITY_DN33074_c0_g1~~TRINITY_DN33074_c0_g1_i1.p1  ORF type:complete len:262 (+),score=38.97 TRINITY_DN33074_c0_g1_i1:86-871(+)